MSAPCDAASARALRAFAKLPAMSPTIGLSWAKAILREAVMTPLYRYSMAQKCWSPDLALALAHTASQSGVMVFCMSSAIAFKPGPEVSGRARPAYHKGRYG